MTTFDDWIKERDRILEDSDMDGLRRMLADVDFEGVKFPDQPDGGLPWPPNGELP